MNRKKNKRYYIAFTTALLTHVLLAALMMPLMKPSTYTNAPPPPAKEVRWVMTSVAAPDPVPVPAPVVLEVPEIPVVAAVPTPPTPPAPPVTPDQPKPKPEPKPKPKPEPKPKPRPKKTPPLEPQVEPAKPTPITSPSSHHNVAPVPCEDPLDLDALAAEVKQPTQTPPPSHSEVNPGAAASNAEAAALCQRHFASMRALIESHKRYPLLARRRGMQGSTEVSFKVHPQGMFEEATVTRSSGITLLDQAALKAIHAASPMQLTPAQQRCPCKVVLTIAFQLTHK